MAYDAPWIRTIDHPSVVCRYLVRMSRKICRERATSIYIATKRAVILMASARPFPAPAILSSV